MRKFTYLIVLFSFAAVFSAQGQNIFEDWSALADYHDVMSATFHPSEEGNLEPIKQESGKLAERASLLAKSEVPVQYQSDDITAAIKQLDKDSKSLDKMVKGGKASDEEITKSLDELHDVFHKIVGLCKDEDH